MSASHRLSDQDPLKQNREAPATMPTPTSDPQWIRTLAIEPRHEDIAHRAYQLYEAHSSENGHDLDHWFQAEHELRKSLHDLADRMVLGESYAVGASMALPQPPLANARRPGLVPSPRSA